MKRVLLACVVALGCTACSDLHAVSLGGLDVAAAGRTAHEDAGEHHGDDDDDEHDKAGSDDDEKPAEHTGDQAGDNSDDSERDAGPRD